LRTASGGRAESRGAGAREGSGGKDRGETDSGEDRVGSGGHPVEGDLAQRENPDSGEDRRERQREARRDVPAGRSSREGGGGTARPEERCRPRDGRVRPGGRFTGGGQAARPGSQGSDRRGSGSRRRSQGGEQD